MFAQRVQNRANRVACGKRVSEPHERGRCSRLPSIVAARLAERSSRRGVSPRELEILRLIAQGKRNKEVADSLGITQETVQTHIKRLFGKLEVHDRTAAVTVALRRGILHIE